MIVTLRQLRDSADEDERLRRVASVLVRSCPFCGAAEAEVCRPVAGFKWYALDRARGVYAHSLRIQKTLAKDPAALPAMLAQFDNALPEEIWSSLI